jgi:hypothetical protein
MATFDHLWHGFRQAILAPYGDLMGAVHALPAVGHRPSPWTTWTLIGLVRHRRRQFWVAEVVATTAGWQSVIPNLDCPNVVWRSRGSNSKVFLIRQQWTKPNGPINPAIDRSRFRIDTMG